MEIFTWHYIIVFKVLVLNRNAWYYMCVNYLYEELLLEAIIVNYGLLLWVTWNNIIACKLLMLDGNTWNDTTVCKLFILYRNSWQEITVYKQMIIGK